MDTCPSCTLPSALPYRIIKSMRLYKCGACGLIFQNPVPSQLELEKIYGESYYQTWGGEEWDSLIKKQKRAYFSSHIRKIKKIKPQGTLLDIGCAKGYFVDLALREGYASYGLEISEYSGEIARRAVGKDRIEIGTLENSSYQSNMFDIITMFDFLEHVPDLDMAFASVSRLLKPDGILHIVTPDTSSFSKKIMGSRWWHYKEEHLYYFSKASLTKLLDRLEYMIQESGPSRKTLSVEYILGQLRTYPVFFISPLFRLLGNLMPPGFRRMLMTFPSGEFYATVCRKIMASP